METSNGNDGHEDLGQALLDHLNALYGYAIVLTKNKIEAEDLVQETYVRALHKLEHLKTGSKLKVWLFTILRNIWINQQHARRNGAFLNPGWNTREVSLRVVEDSPDVLLERKLLRGEVRKAIENLLVAYRQVVILRDFEGCSYREIAHILGCPIGTVMSRLARARLTLRQILSKHVNSGREKS